MGISKAPEIEKKPLRLTREAATEIAALATTHKSQAVWVGKERALFVALSVACKRHDQYIAYMQEFEAHSKLRSMFKLKTSLRGYAIKALSAMRALETNQRELFAEVIHSTHRKNLECASGEQEARVNYKTGAHFLELPGSAIAISEQIEYCLGLIITSADKIIEAELESAETRKNNHMLAIEPLVVEISDSYRSKHSPKLPAALRRFLSLPDYGPSFSSVGRPNDSAALNEFVRSFRESWQETIKEKMPIHVNSKGKPVGAGAKLVFEVARRYLRNQYGENYSWRQCKEALGRGK